MGLTLVGETRRAALLQVERLVALLASLFSKRVFCVGAIRPACAR